MWRQELGDGVGRVITDFYTDSTIRAWYKSYVTALVQRNNTITGVMYRDDPTILAWELINEPTVPADDSGDILAVSPGWLVHVLHVVRVYDKQEMWDTCSINS
jgi:mannan endo-1,4-beta-mannosidase